MFGKRDVKKDRAYIAPVQFMGEPYAYWIDIKTQIEALNLEEQMARNLAQKEEIAALRSKVSYYEAKIQDLGSFMKLNLEVE